MKYQRHIATSIVTPSERAGILADIRDVRRAERARRLPRPERDASGWPRCQHCRQSCTGSYMGRPHCVRCDTYHRLTADVA